MQFIQFRHKQEYKKKLTLDFFPSQESSFVATQCTVENMNKH